ncbi:RING/U-box superfamily protein [Quillaja saponaria]|uniref:RING-type E3 ubiquitin transferase n=1 Tax=Quillaja saponaria TaxID=32244 RepID=A0AAD7LEI9_QUISA|nr:RING/U-box superfamily protein [Quillaja saponaria]
MTMPTISSSISNVYPIDMGFDLDEALAMAEEACRRVAASNNFVSNLPTVALHSHQETDHVCSVCMEELDHGHDHVTSGCRDRSNKRVPCGHVYHANCIASWLSHSNSCPLCRCKLISAEYEYD